MSQWHVAYLGQKKLRCWDLVRQVYAEQCGIALPSYSGPVDDEERAEMKALSGDVDAWPWLEVPRAEAKTFDLVMFKDLQGHEAHVGLIPWSNAEVKMPRDKNAFLHTTMDITSCIRRYDDPIWEPLISRFLRHKEQQ